MERRDRSLKALEELNYLDSLDTEERAQALVRWNNKYLIETKIIDFDLEQDDLLKLSELFYKNINFLKNHKEELRQSMVENRKMKRFLNN